MGVLSGNFGGACVVVWTGHYVGADGAEALVPALLKMSRLRRLDLASASDTCLSGVPVV